jgi:DNA mismatch endonuclease, patch repair protein
MYCPDPLVSLSRIAEATGSSLRHASLIFRAIFVPQPTPYPGLQSLIDAYGSLPTAWLSIKVLVHELPGAIPMIDGNHTISIAGKVVPYPKPAKVSTSKVMRSVRSSDTRYEAQVRKLVHGLGLRYRKNYRLDLPTRKVRPDLVFTRWKIAVFLDGCFWHGCPEHGHIPRSNPDYWQTRLDRNTQRDSEVDACLIDAGWQVIRIWEHVPVEDAALQIANAVEQRLRVMV